MDDLHGLVGTKALYSQFEAQAIPNAEPYVGSVLKKVCKA